MSSPSDAVVNLPADKDSSRSFPAEKEKVVTSVTEVQDVVAVQKVFVEEVSGVESVGTGAVAVSDVGSGFVTDPADGVPLGDVAVGVEKMPVGGILDSGLEGMRSADIGAAIEPVSALGEVPAAAAALESAVSFEGDDRSVLTSDALPRNEATSVDPSIVPESLPMEEVPPDDTIPVDGLADPTVATVVPAEDELTAQELQKTEPGAVTAAIVKDDEKEQGTVLTVVEESVSVLQTRVIVEETVPRTGEVLARNVTEATTVDREMTIDQVETALPQPAGTVDDTAIELPGEEEGTMTVDETTVKKRCRDETFVSEGAGGLSEQAIGQVVDEKADQLPVAAAAGDETLTAGGDGDVPALKRVKADGGGAEANAEQNGSKAVDTQMREHTGDVVQGADSLQHDEAGNEDQMPATELQLGPKLFQTSIELFSYLYELLHGWVVNTDLNKYEFLVVSELLKEGAPHKVGAGISAIQVCMHPSWKCRCYYLIRSDGSVDDFSYRKCVDKLLPLPKSLFLPNGELDLDKVVPGVKGKNRDKENGSFDGAAKGRGGGRGRWGGRGFQGGWGGRGGRGGRGRGGRWT